MNNLLIVFVRKYILYIGGNLLIVYILYIGGRMLYWRLRIEEIGGLRIEDGCYVGG